ncbi:MAG: crotonase/enoyl-CoA hydratase family protein [bacterium]|nr:crotonase/enoyl-CoA hydratase family protein [bacterium]
MSDELLRYELSEEVAILRFDDGKANAISPTALDALNAGLDRAEKEARVVALIGRPGRFSAGFDLSVMRQGPEAAQSLVGGGAELLARMVESPLPIVAGCSGHALAMGALMLLAADQRIGSEGEFKLGLNEVAIGMTLPQFGVELAEERLSRRHLQRSVAQAEIYDPAGATDAGYLDRLVPAEQLEDATLV